MLGTRTRADPRYPKCVALLEPLTDGGISAGVSSTSAADSGATAAAVVGMKVLQSVIPRIMKMTSTAVLRDHRWWSEASEYYSKSFDTIAIAALEFSLAKDGEKKHAEKLAAAAGAPERLLSVAREKDVHPGGREKAAKVDGKAKRTAGVPASHHRLASLESLSFPTPAGISTLHWEWEVEGDDGWIRYTIADAEKLTAAYNNRLHRAECNPLVSLDANYTVDLDTFTQVRNSTGRSRKIRANDGRGKPLVALLKHGSAVSDHDASFTGSDTD